jgi:stage II sporulation protein D
VSHSLALVLAVSVAVRVLERHQPQSLEIQTGDGWAPVRLASGERRLLPRPRLRLPGKLERAYPGVVAIEEESGSLVLINTVGEDDYLVGVLAGELGASEPAALEALAIAARSMIPFLRGRHAGADLCDLTHCQVYVGGEGSTALRSAVEKTAGRILTYRGAPALAPHHAACGGRTTRANGLFPDLPPYIEPVDDQELCRASANFRWTATLHRRQLGLLFRRDVPTTELRIETGDGGMTLGLSAAGLRLTAEELHRRSGASFGWNVIKSARFEAIRQGDALHIQGRGFGHGVGLCQSGAEALARLGKSAQEILALYFPRLQVSR